MASFNYGWWKMKQTHAKLINNERKARLNLEGKRSIAGFVLSTLEKHNHVKYKQIKNQTH